MFYLALGEENHLIVTPCPDRVKEPMAVQAVLKPAAPLGILNDIIQSVERDPLHKKGRAKKFIFKFFNPIEWKEPEWKNQAWREWFLSKARLLYPEIDWQLGPQDLQADTSNPEKIIGNFVLLTTGRMITRMDFQVLAREMKVSFEEIINAAQTMVEEGRGQWIPAVQKVNKRWQCMRCGSMEMEEWPSIYGQAFTCKECTALGALSSLEFLYESIETQTIEDQGLPDAEGLDYRPWRELTPAQEKGSKELINFMEGSSARKLLLWAACGAGKTEVTFPVLNLALHKGLKVLFAAPRQDVIHDIAPRVQKDFPKLKFQLVTGSSPNRFAEGKLVLATTHQVLRFTRVFDLIILDEVDAFPYHGSRMLEWGIAKALKPEGKMIYLTATPSRTLREQALIGAINLVRIPARHHGYSLPIPEWQKNIGVRDGGMDQPLKERLSELITMGPVLIFVPTVKKVASYLKQIEKAFPGISVGGSHSQDPNHRQKLESFLKQEYQVFVSTSILERGVTIPGVQVMVLEADHEIFEERALVQMAGRVGRTFDFPSGKVIFLSPTHTPAIREAIQWIHEQNRVAKAQGLIWD